jgi:hypothetical protein
MLVTSFGLNRPSSGQHPCWYSNSKPLTPVTCKSRNISSPAGVTRTNPANDSSHRTSQCQPLYTTSFSAPQMFCTARETNVMPSLNKEPPLLYDAATQHPSELPCSSDIICTSLLYHLRRTSQKKTPVQRLQTEF